MQYRTLSNLIGVLANTRVVLLLVAKSTTIDGDRVVKAVDHLDTFRMLSLSKAIVTAIC
jgi:hypothetical protein